MPDLTPDEAIAKLRTLPEDQQRQVLVQLSPETRQGILGKLKAGPGTTAPAAPGATPTAPGNPTSTMQAQHPWYTPEGMKEARYRATHAVLDALPMAGGIGGGLLAGTAGIASGPGAVAAAVGGAAAGGALGESAKLALQKHIFPASKGWSPVPSTATDIAKDIAEEGGIQGANEITGQAFGHAIAPALKYFAHTAMVSKAAGVRLLPSEARAGAENFLEKTLRGSFLTAGKMENFRVAQNAETRAAAQKVADSLSTFNGTPEEVGKLVQEGLDQHIADFRVKQKQMYEDIDKAVEEKTIQVPVQKTVGSGFMQQTKTVMQNQLDGPAMPSMVSLKGFAVKELKLLNQEEQVINPALLSDSRSTLQHIVDSPDKVTFQGMAAARSSLLALTRRLDEALPGKQAGFAKKMVSLAHDSMMDAAKNSGIPGLPSAIENANALTAETHRVYEQELVKKIVATKKPEVISRFVASNTAGIQETRDLMTAVPDALKPPIQRQIVLDSLRQSVNRRTGVFDEGKFADLVTKMGDDRGQIVFGPNWKNINELAGLMRRINGPAGLTGGSGAALHNFALMKNMLIASGETLAVPVGLATSGHVLAAGKSLAVEWAGLNALASAMTNPERAVKMLTFARTAAKAAPYAAEGSYEMAKGQTKVTRDLQAIRDKHVAEMQPTQ